MIYLIGIICYLWRKRYKLLAASGALFVVISAEVTIIRQDYFGLMMWASVGALVIIYAVLSEFYKYNSRNRHR